MIKGVIVGTSYTNELTIEQVRIKIADGTVLTFTHSQILRIENTDAVYPDPAQTTTETQSFVSMNRIAHYKSPGTACILSLLLFPGIGQFYNEQPAKGAAFLIFGIGSAFMLYDGSKQEYNYWTGYHNKNIGEAKSGAILYLMTWFASGVDAYNSAKSLNESFGLSVAPNKITLSYHF